jgi:hypothetical protein
MVIVGVSEPPVGNTELPAMNRFSTPCTRQSALTTPLRGSACMRRFNATDRQDIGAGDGTKSSAGESAHPHAGDPAAGVGSLDLGDVRVEIRDHYCPVNS